MIDAILAHPIPVVLLLAAIVVLHRLEAMAQKKGGWAILAYAVHLLLIVCLATIGASLEELLLVLMISAAVLFSRGGEQT